MKDSIFIVEDDADDLKLLLDAFAAINWDHLVSFVSSVELLKHIKALEVNDLPRLIVTDYSMPKLTGFNLVALLKQNDEFRSIKTVVLTGSVNPVEKERLLAAGVVKVCIKPGSFDEYKKIAEELVGMVK